MFPSHDRGDAYVILTQRVAEYNAQLKRSMELDSQNKEKEIRERIKELSDDLNDMAGKYERATFYKQVSGMLHYLERRSSPPVGALINELFIPSLEQQEEMVQKTIDGLMKLRGVWLGSEDEFNRFANSIIQTFEKSGEAGKKAAEEIRRGINPELKQLH